MCFNFIPQFSKTSQVIQRGVFSASSPAIHLPEQHEDLSACSLAVRNFKLCFEL